MSKGGGALELRAAISADAEALPGPVNETVGNVPPPCSFPVDEDCGCVEDWDC